VYLDEAETEATSDAHVSDECSSSTNEGGEQMQAVGLSEQQGTRIAELPEGCPVRGAAFAGARRPVRKHLGEDVNVGW
jgi:hypothetical protein